MLLRQLIDLLEQIAPTRFAESWDNVGLLVGDPAQQFHKILLTIDYTAAVADEAQRESADAIIAYHPPIFDPLKRVNPGLIFDAVRRGIALYSPHTALDVADGGANDMLADALGLHSRQPLRPARYISQLCKLIVFVPPDALDKVADALFNAGAGHIGNYSHCSFRSPGSGTFFGQAGANPAVGQPQRLEKVNEIRFETLLPLNLVPAAIRALHDSHPYEEPAFDLVQLLPAETHGQGRIGSFASPVDRAQLIQRVKHQLNLSHLLIAGPTTGPVHTAAAAAGACGDMINDALAQNAQFYLTGELRHHDALRAAERGMTVACTLHSNSERAVLARLASRLQSQLPPIPILLSQADRDPFAIA